MKPRYLAAKLFLGVAILSAIVGVFLHRPGLRAVDYVNPLFLLFLPRLIPFDVAILSAFFAAIYFRLEKERKREMNMPLTLIHLGSFLLAMFGHATMVSFWTHALVDRPRTVASVPLCGGLLFVGGTAVCCVAFAANIFRSTPTTLPKT